MFIHGSEVISMLLFQVHTLLYFNLLIAWHSMFGDTAGFPKIGKLSVLRKPVVSHSESNYPYSIFLGDLELG